MTTRRKACHAMRRLEQDGARRLVSSPPPGPILAPSRVHLHHAARGISAAPLITRSARRSWRRARTSCRPSAAVQCCHGCPRRVCPPALAVDNKSARSLSRHALPRQGAAAPRRYHADGPCIFKLPKKARFAAAHGLYVDGDLVGSELVSLQHACHMLRCHSPCVCVPTDDL